MIRTLAFIPCLLLALCVATAQEPAAQRNPVTIPAGTTLIVRTTQTLDSKQSNAGQQFVVDLEADIATGDRVIVPRGTQAYGMLTNAKSGGRVVGKSELAVELTSILINNQAVPIVTESVEAAAPKSETRKTARNVGVGAAIGAIADDDGGAATGALVGLGASALTRGKQIQIPAGSILQFRLLAPLTI
jgi:hypothetical protein